MNLNKACMGVHFTSFIIFCKSEIISKLVRKQKQKLKEQFVVGQG